MALLLRLSLSTRPSRWRALILGAGALMSPCLTAGCSEAHASSAGPSIVCTTVMVGDVVRGVAGEGANVTVLFGADVDPHLFRPTRDDVAALTSADAIFASGLHLEANLIPTLDKLAGEGIPVTYLAELILAPDETLTEGGGVVDPHVWMDPSLWARTAKIAASALGTVMGGDNGAPALAKRADAVQAQYLALDRDSEAALASIPEDTRVLITAHDAFGYFGRRYGLEVHAIQGVSTASEAGLGAIEGLVDLIVERRAPAVFFESTVSERSVRALIEGAKARGHDVSIGGVLHSDAPGATGSYRAMVEHNVRMITSALGGTLSAESSAMPPRSGSETAPAR